MSKAKSGGKTAKTAKVGSRNNPMARERVVDLFYNGKKVKPVKLVMPWATYFGAEEQDTGAVIFDIDGTTPLPWAKVRANSTK